MFQGTCASPTGQQFWWCHCKCRLPTLTWTKWWAYSLYTFKVVAPKQGGSTLTALSHFSWFYLFITTLQQSNLHQHLRLWTRSLEMQLSGMKEVNCWNYERILISVNRSKAYYTTLVYYITHWSLGKSYVEAQRAGESTKLNLRIITITIADTHHHYNRTQKQQTFGITKYPVHKCSIHKYHEEKWLGMPYC